MQTVKDEALTAISKLPENTTIEDIMYRLYVIDKVRKGEEAMERGESLSIKEMTDEVNSW